jgi:hypothetical protein
LAGGSGPTHIGIDKDCAEVGVVMAQTIEGYTGYMRRRRWIFEGGQPHYQVGLTQPFKLALDAGTKNGMIHFERLHI